MKTLIFGVNRMIKFNLLELAEDLDGDMLTFSLPTSSDVKRL
jgi:hypothetical protein